MHDLVIRNGRVVDGAETAAFTADIAVDGGKITAVGKIDQPGRREIDAAGLVVTPGWVDIHTHYDGQVTWDPYLAPSSWHGVTTVVMGNCGVGFAPVRPDRHEWLIELMEGVEDIPGAALSEGITWTWESFPEYLDSLDAQPRVLDVATQVPHGAVRAYVMGERGARNEPATAEDIAEMSRIVGEGVAAGALGFSTSRTMLHLAKDGEPVPGTFAAEDELLGIGRAMGAAGHGVFEMASDMAPAEDEFAWMKAMSAETGVPVTYGLLQSPTKADNWKRMLALTEEARAEGAQITAQIACRPTGMVLGWQSTVHPFIGRESYRKLAALPFAERIVHLRDPDVRARILSEPSKPMGAIGMILTQGFDRMFRLEHDGGLDYEPRAEDSIAALAAATGRQPDAIVYDMLMEKDGAGYIYLPLLNYAEFNFDHIHEMMNHPNTVLSLSDGGAHCGVICDASFPTYMLTHWTRDRARGPRLSLEKVVSMQTRDTARLYGLHDRGVIAPGMKADFNLIDYDKLAIMAPEMAFDLPAQGRRLIQRAQGYAATIVSGVVTFEAGEATGEMPGKLIRGPQQANLAIAAE
ncbi:amidohydrolase family protein [Phenylobacterium sp.]|uniref:N-acyl-D-amino-acid deacylase family protein n=1 Tax=Phenylobacterium sp. TaxID=1871053 RepID=UPI00272FFB65|nr:amidohydrolase family protein [Phenylobacterium sp.]MDP1599718.1 amidohydrolase family protein [Phenylobacterium sp.]MDP3593917.1 amidohydrolase family protein [Phenylobacterium sp.]